MIQLYLKKMENFEDLTSETNERQLFEERENERLIKGAKEIESLEQTEFKE